MAKETAHKLEPKFVHLIAQDLGCRPRQVEAADGLFAEGSTVPFVARYRKEVTGGLVDEQLEEITKRRDYFLELVERRDSILDTIDQQGKLTDELAAAIRQAVGKQELEDLYLPYKPKRRTRAQMARQRGLEPLAEMLLRTTSPKAVPSELAAAYVDSAKGVEDVEAALAGARDILAERMAESAENRALVRRAMAGDAVLEVRVAAGKETLKEAMVYRDYFDHREPASKLPSHRLLAVLRGEKEGFLSVSLALDDSSLILRLAGRWRVPLESPCGKHVVGATEDGYKRLLRPSIANELRGELRQRAEAEAIAVFRANLEALLMQAPLGQIPVLGADPGFRTGCKIAVTDPTGRVLATAVIFPVPPKADEVTAAKTVLGLVAEHGIKAVAIGNGTGSRETELFFRELLRQASLDKLMVTIVPETGASVYSASTVARDELPDLDVSLRGAVSIARRLQDPLAELVKIEPRSLGVGQYQHDVDQGALKSELNLAVEGVVNRVGVEVNTASAHLLRQVSGLNPRLAKAVVRRRDETGAFPCRQALLEVPGLGPKTFEQAAGFLRVRGSREPLDRTAVHPERYPLVEKMAAQLEVSVDGLVGRPEMVARLDLSQFRNEQEGVGSYTLEDIRQELERPGRDPRSTFESPNWRDDVRSVDDLEVGMVMEGRVSNVTNFGAFVDIGVKRDGLVHLSELSRGWVEDPRKVVRVGDVVKTQVMEVDKERGRISLSIKALQPEAPVAKQARAKNPPRPRRPPKDGAPVPKRGKKRRPATVEDLIRRFNRPR